MFELGIVTSLLLLMAIAMFGGVMGWYLRNKIADSSLELRSQSADIDWLRSALADSEKRCVQQAEWLSGLEAELVDLRPEDVIK